MGAGRTTSGQSDDVDVPESTSSASLMGFDGWDRFEPLTGGRGGARLACKDGLATS
ncbi:hypothetical protein NSZ01_37890 [Nocardioides szechwanensis]|uniref:Uncharacterized protein n=1 Tax=Nocardioides szechwanensis TaxID=1005944 RepID=A0A1H0LSZ6_9ACTN|nr:hypothetical protein NSZ01_37890 [Nocardioides szechwanensis]SDO71161.1 hypothetical protein SAMN05192576_0307 [Nocardioides szechwanensis]